MFRLLYLIIWNKKRVVCSWKRYRVIEKGTLTLGNLTKLMMTHDQYNLLIGRSCECLLYRQGARVPGATSYGWTWALLENNPFVKPHKWTLITHELGCSELKGYGCPGLTRIASCADSIGFRVWVFLPSVGNGGWLPAWNLRNNGFSTPVPAFVCVDYIEKNPATNW